VGGHDGELTVLSLEDGRTIKAGRPHSYAIMRIEFAATRPLMATAAMDGYLQLWDTHTWERKARLRADPNEIYSVAFHPDGARMVTGARGSAALTVWDVESGRELARLQSPLGGQLNRLYFVDENTLIGWTGRFVANLEDKVTIWRAPTFSAIQAAESQQAMRHRQNSGLSASANR
jgi:WD40 repeat protein